MLYFGNWWELVTYTFKLVDPKMDTFHIALTDEVTLVQIFIQSDQSLM